MGSPRASVSGGFGGDDRLRQGYGGPPKPEAKAEVPEDT